MIPSMVPFVVNSRPSGSTAAITHTKRAVDLSDGEGYISADGYHWERVETEQQSNLCLKVYASGRD